MKKALINCVILDGTRDIKPQSGLTVLIEEEKISDILPSEQADLTGYEVVDLQGAYLLPGLINLHAHLALSGKPPKSDKKVDYRGLFKLLSSSKLIQAYFRNNGADYARSELMSGVTTVRAVGGILDLDGRNRDSINAGRQLGSRLLCANTAISVPDGHFAGSIATEAASPEQALEHLNQIVATKPDLIKLMITGGVMDASEEGEPGVLRMPPEIVKAVCDKAHEMGYQVAAHVESPLGVKVALENGVDTIEHGATPDEEIIRLFRERKAADICTLSPAIPYAEFELSESKAPEVARRNGRIVLDGIIACAKACLENDIPVGLGNDTGCNFVTHYNFWRELYYFHKYVGVSNSFALHTATLRNAQIVGIDGITGSIEKGKSADMIVVRENPLDDLRALRHLDKVIFRGHIINKPSFKPVKGVDELLDKYM